MVVEDLEATDETVVVDSRGHHLLEHGHVFLVGLLVDVGEVLGEAAVGPALFGAQLTLVLALVGPTNRRMGLGHPAMDPQLWSLTQCYSVYCFKDHSFAYRANQGHSIFPLLALRPSKAFLN